jgi:hypothetical protein
MANVLARLPNITVSRVHEMLPLHPTHRPIQFASINFHPIDFALYCEFFLASVFKVL